MFSERMQVSGRLHPVAGEEFPLRKMNRREFVATGAAAGASVFACQNAFEVPFERSDQSVASSNQANREIVPLAAVPFPMRNVRLGPGPFSAAAEANRRYLQTLQTDRLLHTF